MPIYEYNCLKCEIDFELLVRANEKPACPSCESEQVEKQLSVAASPKTGGSSLPLSSQGPSCGMPRCCGGGCQE